MQNDCEALRQRQAKQTVKLKAKATLSNQHTHTHIKNRQVHKTESFIQMNRTQCFKAWPTCVMVALKYLYRMRCQELHCVRWLFEFEN